MELSDVRAFARVADLGSVSAAARSLGLPKSTISRSLTRLEVSVGAVLIDRSTRHLRLSDAGTLFRPDAAVSWPTSTRREPLWKTLPGFRAERCG